MQTYTHTRIQSRTHARLRTRIHSVEAGRAQSDGVDGFALFRVLVVTYVCAGIAVSAWVAKKVRYKPGISCSLSNSANKCPEEVVSTHDFAANQNARIIGVFAPNYTRIAPHALLSMIEPMFVLLFKQRAIFEQTYVPNARMKSISVVVCNYVCLLKKSEGSNKNDAEVADR